MDEEMKELVKKREKEGWVKSRMIIEVLAVTEEAAKSSLEKHVDNMGKEENALVYRKEFREIKEMENPMPNVPKGYSNIVELELLTKDYEKLIYLVMTYGPSSTEILSPDNIKLNMGEAQGIVNTVADMVHKFASAGLGGLLINV